MAVSRIKNVAKLTLLLGVPIAVLVGTFSCGVYCGHENRAAVLRFERDWLGLDVTVPGEPPKPEPAKTEPVKPEPVKTEPVKTEPVKTEPVKTEPVKTEPKTEPVKTEPVPVPVPVTPEPARADELPFAMPEPAPLAGDNKAKLDNLVRVSVKVLVDPVFAARRPDWLTYVQRHVTWASQVLEKQVGVRLDLHGVVRMEEIPQGLADVQGQAREGSDLLLVFVDREFRGPVAVPEIAGANVDVMLVQAVGRSRDDAGHLRGLLFALGQVLGAEALAEGDESWMGGVRVDDARPLKLDATNRMRMLTRKSLPFASPPKPAEAPGEPKLPSVEDEEPAPPEEESN